MAIVGKKPSMWYGTTLICKFPNQVSIIGEAPMKLVDLPNSSDKEAIALGVGGLGVKVPPIIFFALLGEPFIYISRGSKFNAKIRGVQPSTNPRALQNHAPSKLRFIPYNIMGVEQTKGIIEIELDPTELANKTKDIEVKLNRFFDYKVVVEYKDSKDYYIVMADEPTYISNVYFIHNWSLS